MIKKFLITILFTLVLGGGASANLNFKLENCRDIELGKEIYTYEFFGDLKEVIISSKDNVNTNYGKINVDSFEFINNYFIVSGANENNEFLILQEEKVVIKTNIGNKLITKQKCK